MTKVDKMGSMVLLVIAAIVASVTGYEGYAPLFMLLMICIGVVPSAPAEEEVVEVSQVVEPTSKTIARKRLASLIALNGNIRGSVKADDINFDDMFELFLMHKSKFMAIELDLYKRALRSGKKDEELKYMVAPLMRVGALKKELDFYRDVALAF